MLLNLSEGKPTEMASLKAMDSVEFWHFYKNWNKRQKAIADAYKQ